MMHWRFLSCLILCVSIFPAHADWDFSGQTSLFMSQTEYRPDDSASILANQTTFNDTIFNTRLMAHKSWSRYDFNIHYQLAGLSGDSYALGAAGLLPGGSSIPNDDARLFNLTQVLDTNDYGGWIQRLDRLNIAYAGDHWVWKLGRQAISWGDGLVFQPLDIFNPFSPLAIDTSYKPGDDLLYSQWLFDNGDDVQFIYLPRRDPTSGQLQPTDDSTAVKYHMQTGWGGWDFLLARHYQDDILALGHVQNVGGGVWRIDVNHTRLSSGNSAWFAVSNFDYSWLAFNHNMYGFIELYYNGLGARRIDLSSINNALRDRLQRGEVFSLGRYELALGSTLEMTPRWNTNLLAIANPDDGSSIWRWNFAFDWLQDTKLQFGIQTGVGARGSEYGGLASSPPGSYQGVGDRYYIYIQQYY